MDVCEQYTISQPITLSKLAGSVPSGSYTRLLDLMEDYAYTITNRKDRSPNNGGIKMKDGNYGYLTMLECWRLMGFEDRDFQATLQEHPTNGAMNRTLYHQAGSNIVVQVMESIFELILSEKYAVEDVMENESGQMQLIC
ncbi:hypothetical protein CSV60_05965 [Sporosarcina sp. P7]|uniref:DNA cytosine methyltransferase n=1 Tax=Sporosarcina sp. P16b TaxID=2048261 RepID=UPI000C16BE6D|nr:DNA cytosine methyltransferase [Sporosarcina sp. P16b]PIC69884.1 hypothetical protein CSV77_11485 [Sporosarcina sp. P16b]PID25172.1 hypothetical protein CSV60_05965 [Sporosarcina sp. P7]